MKTTIVTIAAMFVVAWALNESVAPVPDNLLLMNVEALAGPGGGGDIIDPNEPELLICFDKFDYTQTNHHYERMCKSEGPQRSSGMDDPCVAEYSYHPPISFKMCIKNPKPSEPQ